MKLMLTLIVVGLAIGFLCGFCVGEVMHRKRLKREGIWIQLLDEAGVLRLNSILNGTTNFIHVPMTTAATNR